MADKMVKNTAGILDSKYYVKIRYRVKVVGGPISVVPYIRYLSEKASDVYELAERRS